MTEIATAAEPREIFALPVNPVMVSQVAENPVMTRPVTTVIGDVTAMVKESSPVDELMTPDADVVTPQMVKVPAKFAVTPPLTPGAVHDDAKPLTDEVGESHTVAVADVKAIPDVSPSELTDPTMDQLFDARYTPLTETEPPPMASVPPKLAVTVPSDVDEPVGTSVIVAVADVKEIPDVMVKVPVDNVTDQSFAAL